MKALFLVWLSVRPQQRQAAQLRRVAANRRRGRCCFGPCVPHEAARAAISERRGHQREATRACYWLASQRSSCVPGCGKRGCGCGCGCGRGRGRRVSSWFRAAWQRFSCRAEIAASDRAAQRLMCYASCLSFSAIVILSRRFGPDASACLRNFRFSGRSRL